MFLKHNYLNEQLARVQLSRILRKFIFTVHYWFFNSHYWQYAQQCLKYNYRNVLLIIKSTTLDWILKKLSLRVFAVTGRDFEKLHAYQFLVTRWLQKNTHPLSPRVFRTIHWKDTQASPLHRHQGKDTTLQVARTTLIPAPQTMGTLEWEKKQKRSFVSSLSILPIFR